jgi:hypothetical protein
MARRRAAAAVRGAEEGDEPTPSARCVLSPAILPSAEGAWESVTAGVEVTETTGGVDAWLPEALSTLLATAPEESGESETERGWEQPDSPETPVRNRNNRSLAIGDGRDRRVIGSVLGEMPPTGVLPPLRWKQPDETSRERSRKNCVDAREPP